MILPYLMDRPSLSQDLRRQLSDLQEKHPHHKVRVKALTVLLADQKISFAQIKAITGIGSVNTIKTYLRDFAQGGMAVLTRLSFRQAQSKLKPFEAQIRHYFTQQAPATIAEIISDIHALTNILLGRTAMSRYIQSLGVKRRKTVVVPAGAQPDKQQTYHDETLMPCLQEAKAGQREVFFVDAAHFVLGAFLSFVWGFERTLVRSPSGRQRFNVLGALNATSKALITVCNDTYITSTQVCELLHKIRASTTRPITIVLDNARYQRCYMVEALAKELNITLAFLPAYSPNLNLIERLWKLLKKVCLNSRYHKDFAIFKQVIVDFLENMHTKHAAQLASLLTLNFKIFTHHEMQQAGKI